LQNEVNNMLQMINVTVLIIDLLVADHDQTNTETHFCDSMHMPNSCQLTKDKMLAFEKQSEHWPPWMDLVRGSHVSWRTQGAQ